MCVRPILRYGKLRNEFRLAWEARALVRPNQISPKSALHVVEKYTFGPSGVKTLEGKADFMSCLKARPTKRETFSAACFAAEAVMGCGTPALCGNS